MKKLQIKSPCPENWDKMQGDGKKRYCSSCQHHVEDFTDKSVEEIVKILEGREGRTCGRLRKSQLNPIKKIAATVMVGAMLAGCQPEPNVLGEISAPPPIERDTSEREETEELSKNEVIDALENSKKECDILLGDTITFELDEELMGIVNISRMRDVDFEFMGDIDIITDGIEGDLGEKLREELDNFNNE